MILSIRRSLLWWMLAAILASCSTPRNSIPVDSYLNFSNAEVLESLKSRSLDYTWFNGKAKTRIESPEENASGLLYLRNPRDSLIWLLIKKRSVEASRILLKPDSLYVIYRLEQTYEKQAISDVNNSLNLQLSFSEIQDIISGNVPIPDEKTITIKKEKDVYVIKGVFRDIKIKYLLDARNLQLLEGQYTDSRGRSINSKYDDYKLYEGKGEIPYFRSYEFTTPGEERTYIELEIVEIEFDKPERILFSIPPHYEEVH